MIKSTGKFLKSLVFLHCFFIGNVVYATDILPEPDHTEIFNFKDDHRRDTPEGSFSQFNAYCDEGDYENAVEFLDLRFVPKSKREEQGKILAKKLKYIFDRSVRLEDITLSSERKGYQKDGLHKSQERISIIQFENKDYPIYMERLWGPKTLVWKFSQKTLKKVDDLHKEMSYFAIADYLPKVLVDSNLFGLPYWQWIVLLMIALFTFFIAKIVGNKTLQYISKLNKFVSIFPSVDSFQSLNKPLFFIFYIILFYLSTKILHLTVVIEHLIMVLSLCGLTFFFLALAFKSSDVFTISFQKILKRRGFYAASSAVPLTRRFFKIVLVCFSGLVVLQIFDVNITALLAGLGVGGIAVALAAQKSLENLFSGVALMTDQPVRIGDTCMFDERIGEVEDIGVRSTRIRTLERSILIIPNREFSQMKLENLSRRDKIKLETTLQLTYDTSPSLMRHILKQLRSLQEKHPKIVQDGYSRVRLLELGSHSLDIEFYAHVRTPKWYAYLEIREEVLLSIMEIIHSCGAKFAFPTRTVHSIPHSEEKQNHQHWEEDERELV
ncbi:MAG: mechanosensitive ion channel family protein [Oligoflexales bacterium]